MIEVLSLGAGIQSSTVLLRSIRGELPKLDHAIFADTGYEPAAVYNWLETLREEAETAGIQFHVVSQGNIKTDMLRVERIDKAIPVSDYSTVTSSTIPFFVDTGGKRGQLRRQCTYQYKVRPIETCMRREVLNLKPRQHAPKDCVIRHWMGISFDERQRMRLASNPWEEFHYPLVDERWTRAMCIQWLDETGFKDVPRSACICCPYHTNREWREMKRNRPEEFADAVEFDNATRKLGGTRGDCFLHQSLVPLSEVDLRTDVDRGQQTFSFADECEGICGV